MDRNQLLNDPEAATRYALDGRQARIWTTMPAIVQSVNWGHMTLECVPAIQGVQTNPDGTTQYINLPRCVDCPIVFPSGGGFTLTFPIIVGDEILLHIASRCIDSWWQSGGYGIPIEFRMHDLSDGFAQCGPKSLPNVVSGISADNVQLRSDDGTTYLEITPEKIMNLVAPAGVNITGNLTVTGDVIAGSSEISLTEHVHGGVLPGGSNTGGPVG